MTVDRIERPGQLERLDGVSGPVDEVPVDEEPIDAESIDEGPIGEATAAGRPGFEGSYLGDASALRDNTRLECKICWWVYDPVDGDPVWQIAAGTPFSALPAHWRCPQCDGDAEQFMVLPDPSDA